MAMQVEIRAKKNSAFEAEKLFVPVTKPYTNDNQEVLNGPNGWISMVFGG